MASWHTSTHPEALFTRTLLAERLTERARHNLVGVRLTETARDGAASERTLQSATQLGDALESVFGIEPPAPIEAIYAKVAATG